MARMFRSKNRGLLACLAALVLLVGVSGITIMQAQTQTQTFTCAGGFTEEVLLGPTPLMTSLTTVPNPVIPKNLATGQPELRADLVDYVQNLGAAIRLGKALFWDMQVGSDNKTACATCHFQAGQDGRTRNQLNPGPNGEWDSAAFAPNSDLWDGAYPFVDREGGINTTDNITGSQGVRKMVFNGLSKSGAELTSLVADPVFNVNGQNVRQVTGRNAPSTINAVFNHRNFFDGRAQAEFNGVNPFGGRDTSARVWYVGVLGPTQINISIRDASLASQSVGPVLNDVEMSAKGRTWGDLGRKLMIVKPLGLQQVDPTDSVLGTYAVAGGNGLTTTYKAMIQAAFKPKWWNTTKSVRVNGKSYTMMEANMSLFWGISVMLYQATLVADQTPMDRYLASRTLTTPAGNPALLDEVVARLQQDFGVTVTTADIINGLNLFELPPPPAPAPNGLGCMLCHVGAETTSASSRNLNHGVEADDVAFVNAGFDQRMERMFWRLPPLAAGSNEVTLNPLAWTLTESNTVTGWGPEDVPLAVYDTGYYNIGVRPQTEDAGIAANDPFGNPWSIVRMLQATIMDPSYIKVPGAALNCGATIIKNSTGYPLLSGSLRKTERTRVEGSFKVPGLRNVELNAPYFHNGGKASLRQLMEFYDDGADFNTETALAPLIRPLHMTPDQTRDVIAFLLALTDERVRWRRAPFDHPQLFKPSGESAPGVDNMIELPAVGAAGGAPIERFLNLNPFQ